jgi:hypothetical protein
MDIEIGEMENVIQVTDSRALFDPHTIERLVREMMARLKDTEARDQRADADRTYTRNVTGDK